MYLQALARVESAHPESEFRSTLRALFAAVLNPTVQATWSGGRRRAALTPRTTATDEGYG
jgi:hypothetical protein